MALVSLIASVRVASVHHAEDGAEEFGEVEIGARGDIRPDSR